MKMSEAHDRRPINLEMFAGYETNVCIGLQNVCGRNVGYWKC